MNWYSTSWPSPPPLPPPHTHTKSPPWYSMRTTSHVYPPPPHPHSHPHPHPHPHPCTTTVSISWWIWKYKTWYHTLPLFVSHCCSGLKSLNTCSSVLSTELYFWNLFSCCCCVLWQYFVQRRSVGSALIEVLLLFTERHQLHHPPLPQIFFPPSLHVLLWISYFF